MNSFPLSAYHHLVRERQGLWLWPSQNGTFLRVLTQAANEIEPNSKLSPDNLLEGFGVSAVFVPQLSIMHIVYFNEI